MVTVTNSKIFSEPVYNYTRDFPYLWEEIALPVPYSADRSRAEEILLEAARRYALDPNAVMLQAKEHLQRRFGVAPVGLAPRVFYRLTDNWLELTVRFVFETHEVRAAKDAMNRYILAELDRAGIAVASSTYDIVGLPPIELKRGCAGTAGGVMPG